ncbi:Fic/DOC family N-terminal domain-containing protein [uncultured Rhodoblastus sp.]|uniref:Fic family protein n=1 Tax=uncultured Rhodoblastus sp. TaxID=543037 RepID=UPI0025DF8A11|nr:Fic/DOC family N-terminal domain-containing protein [uncultured Rhodoblastus sp.]
MLKATYHLPDLPPPVDLDTVRVWKALAAANRALAELKGRAATIPNQGILIDTLALQEAKASSEIENIVTTQDELFQADLFPEGPQSAAAKEVALYRNALRLGHRQLAETQGIISNNTLIEMFRLLKGREDGFRDTPGTALKNDRTGEIVYVPPQDGAAVRAHMGALERFINDDAASPLDPLIKMALIHHQFESIHPFSDGNGRIGRILNVLYLTRTGLLDIPVLYLSRHITQTKADYYRLLQAVRDAEGPEAAARAWENWVIYMVQAVASTATTTLSLVEGIRFQMASVKQRMRAEMPKLYSQDLLNNLFRHPYTRIDYVVQDLKVTRQTAARHLDTLAEHGFVAKHQAGRSNYYINQELVRLFLDVSGGQ